MSIFVFLGIPALLFVLLILWSLRRSERSDQRESGDGTVPPPQKPAVTSPRGEPPAEGPETTPRFTLDYTGRLWVDKKHKGFFRPLRRPKHERQEPP